jgi:hypothetical protein
VPAAISFQLKIEWKNGTMNNSEPRTTPKKVFNSSWAAFYLYYVAIAICWLGPHLNPTFAARIFLTPLIGFILGLLLFGGVLYLKYGQHYEMDAEGVKTIYRYPPREQRLYWHEIDKITVRAGLTQTILGIGNIAVQPRRGEEMVWYGVESPKLLKILMERGIDESAAN